MIFISGVHGVGKSYFCNLVKESTGIEVYSASALIAGEKQSGFAKDKLIPDIGDNQQYLLLTLDKLKASRKNFILDGHFCLLNASGEVQRIPYKTFAALRPDAIILLTEKPEVVMSRRRERDNVEFAPQSIEAFQQEEVAYAKEIAASIGAKLFISNGADNLAQAVDFIRMFSEGAGEAIAQNYLE